MKLLKDEKAQTAFEAMLIIAVAVIMATLLAYVVKTSTAPSAGTLSRTVPIEETIPLPE